MRGHVRDVPYAKKTMTTAETKEDLEQLLADLLEEAHDLRMKYEALSWFTEAKVAEFVLARKEFERERDELLNQRDHLALRLEQVMHDLGVMRSRQEQVHGQLVRVRKQRDRVRERVVALEESRAVRIAAVLRRFTRRS